MSKGFNAGVMPGEPIFLTTVTEEFDVAKDAPALLEAMKNAFDAAAEPMYMIDDMRKMRVSFSDVVNGLALSTRGDLGIANHPKVRKIIIVTTNELLKFSSNALKQAQYGGISNVEVFTSLEAALTAIRGEMDVTKH